MIPENVCPGFLPGGVFLTGVQGRDPTERWMSQSHRVWSQGRFRSWNLEQRTRRGGAQATEKELQKCIGSGLGLCTLIWAHTG